MAHVQVTTETCYLQLLSLAEGFRTCTPPDMQSTLQCLMAILNLPDLETLPPLYIARTNLQIAKLLSEHTTDTEYTRGYLEKAFQTTTIGTPEHDDIKFQAAFMLAIIFEKQQSNPGNAITLLRRCLDNSAHNIFWHCKLLFQLAQVYCNTGSYSDASVVLSNGADYAYSVGAHYSRILFLLSKGMVLMIDRNMSEVRNVLNVAGQLVETWNGSIEQKEGLKVFFLVLQVCHHLNNGQVKSVKSPLKLLQQSIQNITTLQPDNPNGDNIALTGDGFQWMPKEHMCILVYLVTVLHSMQSGYMDKAQKYTEKALMQIEALKQGTDGQTPVASIIGKSPLLNTFQLILLEHIAMCRLVMGSKSLAIKETVQAMQLCYRSQNATLQARHKPVLHSLLGLYAMSMNQMNEAEVQLSRVLREQNISPELRILVSLNLCIVFLKMNREMELNDLLNKMNPEHFPSQSQSLKAAAYYVMGLVAFFQRRGSDAKRCLRETLKMANAEDLNRLTSCSLVLLGHIFYATGSIKESMNMVTPAMQLAEKIPDIQVQCWATALLKDLYRMTGDPLKEQEYTQLHHQFSSQEYNDHCQAMSQNEHRFISVSI